MIEATETHRRTNSRREAQKLFVQYWRVVYRCAARYGLRQPEAERVVHTVVRRAVGEGSEGPAEPRLRRATRAVLAECACDRSSAFGLPAPPSSFDAGAAPGFDTMWESEWRRNLLQTCVDRAGTEVERSDFRAFGLSALRGWTKAATAEYLRISPGRVELANDRVLTRVRQLVKLGSVA